MLHISKFHISFIPPATVFVLAINSKRRGSFSDVLRGKLGDFSRCLALIVQGSLSKLGMLSHLDTWDAVLSNEDADVEKDQWEFSPRGFRRFCSNALSGNSGDALSEAMITLVESAQFSSMRSRRKTWIGAGCVMVKEFNLSNFQWWKKVVDVGRLPFACLPCSYASTVHLSSQSHNVNSNKQQQNLTRGRYYLRIIGEVTWRVSFFKVHVLLLSKQREETRTHTKEMLCVKEWTVMMSARCEEGKLKNVSIEIYECWCWLS